MTHDPRELDAARLASEVRRVHNLARALVGNSHDGEDIAQDAWVTALEVAPVSGRQLNAWISAVVRNHARQLRRSERRRVRRELRAAAMREEFVAEDLVERLDLLRSTLSHVRALDEPYRSTLLLRYVDGHEPEEVARRLGVPNATVRTRLKRGIEKLRARIDANTEGGRRTWIIAFAPFFLNQAVPAGPAGDPGSSPTGLTRSASCKVKLAPLLVTVLIVGAVATLAMSATKGALPEEGGATPSVTGGHGPSADDSVVASVSVRRVPWRQGQGGGQANGGPRFAALVLANEEGARVVSLWEVLVNQPAIRRRTLGKSPWNARPLSASPRVLRWQVPPEDGEPAKRYLARLLHVNFKTFAVREVRRVVQAHGLGEARGLIYADTSDGLIHIDAESGAVVALPFRLEVLAQHGADWLVQTDGQLARFDAAKAEIVRRYPKARAIDLRQLQPTDWDGGRFVVRGGGYLDREGREVRSLGFRQQSIVFQELRICDLATGDESTVRRRIQAQGGSGRGVVPSKLPTQLVAGMFRYVERLPATGEHADLNAFDLERDTEWVTIDIASGKELLRVPYHQRGAAPDVLRERGVPDYLRAAFDVGSWVDDESIAREFLSLCDVEFGPIRQTSRTVDGKHLLVLAGDTLHHCNLEARECQSWKAPEDWASVLSLELHEIRE